MTAQRRRTIVLALGGPFGRADPAALCERVGELVEDSGADVVLCDIGAVVPDAAAVSALARLQLTARRLGCEVRLRCVDEELRELLAFMGLSDVLRLEPGGQPEQREQRLGVEEERELDDPPG